MVTLQLTEDQYDLITGALTICEQMAMFDGHVTYQWQLHALHEELEQQRGAQAA